MNNNFRYAHLTVKNILEVYWSDYRIQPLIASLPYYGDDAPKSRFVVDVNGDALNTDHFRVFDPPTSIRNLERNGPSQGSCSARRIVTVLHVKQRRYSINKYKTPSIRPPSKQNHIRTARSDDLYPQSIKGNHLTNTVLNTVQISLDSLPPGKLRAQASTPA